MSEDLFRIVITAAVLLAMIAFLVQAAVAIGLYRVARKMQQKVSPLVDKAEALVTRVGPVVDEAKPVIARIGPVIDTIRPVIAKAGPAVDKAKDILTSTHQIIEDTRPRISEIATEAVGIARGARQEVDHLRGLVHDAGDRAKERMEQIDHSVDHTIEQVEHVSESMKRAVLRPVREVNGIAAGISAAVSTLARKKFPVDSATQDEEMFI